MGKHSRSDSDTSSADGAPSYKFRETLDRDPDSADEESLGKPYPTKKTHYPAPYDPAVKATSSSNEKDASVEPKEQQSETTNVDKNDQPELVPKADGDDNKNDTSTSDKPTVTKPLAFSTPSGSSSFGNGFDAFASSNPWKKKISESNSAASKTANPSITLSGGGFGSFASISPFAAGAAAAKANASAGAKPSSDSASDENKKEETSPKETEQTATSTDNETVEVSDNFQKLDEILTGEESDEIIHSVRCKLYRMESGAWKERGTGLLKVNRFSEGKGARLVMRADGTHRLLLNVPLFSKFSSSIYAERYIKLTCIEDQSPQNYMLKIANSELAADLESAIQDELKLLITEESTEETNDNKTD